MKYIMKEVRELKESSSAMCICDENEVAKESVWCDCMNELQPGNYHQ